MECLFDKRLKVPVDTGEKGSSIAVVPHSLIWLDTNRDLSDATRSRCFITFIVCLSVLFASAYRIIVIDTARASSEHRIQEQPPAPWASEEARGASTPRTSCFRQDV